MSEAFVGMLKIDSTRVYESVLSPDKENCEAQMVKRSEGKPYFVYDLHAENAAQLIQDWFKTINWSEPIETTEGRVQHMRKMLN